MATWRWARGALFSAAVVLALPACSSQLAENRGPGAAPASLPNSVSAIQVQEQGDAVQIRVETSAQAGYSLVRQVNPPRLMLELSRTSLGDYRRNIPVNKGVVAFLKPVSAGANSSLEVYLNGEAAYDIDSAERVITLNLRPASQQEAPEPAGSPAATVEPAPPPAAPAELKTEAAPAAAPPAPAAAMKEPEPEPAPPAEPAKFFTAIDVAKEADGTLVTLRGDGALSYEYFLVEGKSLVVDIAGVGNKVWPLLRKVDDAWVRQIRVGEHFQPKKSVRVVFDLKRVDGHRVSGEGGTITVAFGAPVEQAAAPEAGAANTVTEVYFRPLEDRSRIEIKTAVRPEFKVVDTEDPLRVIVEVANARIAPKDQKTLDLSNLNREVTRITSFQFQRDQTPMVRVAAQLRSRVPFRVTAVSDGAQVEFDRAAEPAAPVAAPAPPAVAPAPAAGAAVMAATAPAEKPAEAAAEKKTFTGRKLSLDFKDADVNDILRLISEVSGLNFVAGTEVKGTVTIRLADVPWDQALDIILRSNQPPLAQIRESENIIRITTLDKILDEEAKRRRIEEDKQKTLDQQKQLEPLVTKSYSISYAKVSDIKDVVEKSFSSERGKGLIQADERTNTLIVQDLAANIAEIDKVVLSLDTPTPAVLVEARIVEVGDDFGREVGIQWGIKGAADAQHGNALPFKFPNSVNVGGTENGGNYMVNLPAASTVAGIGFSFGHIANTLSLDLKLSAMEKMGKTKILSNPKVLVIHKNKAIINVGSQLPIPKTDSEGNRTVEFKDVGIKLEVEPQVTNDRRIFMDIQIEKSSPGPDVKTTEGTMFSIDTRRAQTKVLIADGETTVIGGIYQQTNRTSENSVPGLGRIPVLGWLFKSRGTTEARTELMIFLTPRVVTL